MLKKIIIALFALVIIAGAGLFYLSANLEPLIKAAIEKYGSMATKSDVRLDSVKLSLKDGTGSLSGLTIWNPQGFSKEKAFYLGQINVKIDTRTISGTGPIVINNIKIEKPEILYEVAENGSNNLAVIANNAKSLGGKTTTNATEKKATTSSDAPERKILVQDITIQNGNIAVRHQALKGQELHTAMPDIHMKNVGSDRSGITAEQVASVIMNQISIKAMEAAGQSLTQQMKTIATEKIQELGSKLLNFGK